MDPIFSLFSDVGSVNDRRQSGDDSQSPVSSGSGSTAQLTGCENEQQASVTGENDSSINSDIETALEYIRSKNPEFTHNLEPQNNTCTRDANFDIGDILEDLASGDIPIESLGDTFCTSQVSNLQLLNGTETVHTHDKHGVEISRSIELQEVIPARSKNIYLASNLPVINLDDVEINEQSQFELVSQISMNQTHAIDSNVQHIEGISNTDSGDQSNILKLLSANETNCSIKTPCHLGVQRCSSDLKNVKNSKNIQVI